VAFLVQGVTHMRTITLLVLFVLAMVLLWAPRLGLFPPALPCSGCTVAAGVT